MERRMLLEHLAQAERHVIEGERHMARQREIIRELAGHEGDVEAARDLLEQYEQMQRHHLADRHRILQELREMGEQ